MKNKKTLSKTAAVKAVSAPVTATAIPAAAGMMCCCTACPCC